MLMSREVKTKAENDRSGVSKNDHELIEISINLPFNLHNIAE